MRIWPVNYLFLPSTNTKMAELEAELSRLNDREAEWKMFMFWCSDFVKREDKNTLNLLNFILFLTKITMQES